MLVTEPLPLVMNASTGVEGGGIYARQVARGNCVLGGGQGFALDDARARPGQHAVIEILRQAVELYPFLEGAQAIRTWSGTEGYLPDRQPVIGHSSTTPVCCMRSVLPAPVSRSARRWARRSPK